MRGRSLFGPFVLLVAFAAPAWAQSAGRAFTPDDALGVKSVRIQDVTDDGRWVAATLQSRGDRLGVDHQRFGDPTYLSPSVADLLVIDTRSGAETRLFDEPVQVRGVAWAPDGARLAFFLRHGDAYGLYIHDAAEGTTEEVVLTSSKALSSSSPLEWSPDGASIFIGLRPEGWAAEARAAFMELTEGPIIVQDSRNDFLAWDRVRNLDDREIPALVSVADGSVHEILPESNIQSLRFSEDGSFVTYVLVDEQKTVYKRNEGTDYEIFRLDLDSGEPVSIMESTQRRTQTNWNDAGDAFAYGKDGNVFLRELDADSAVNLTEEYRVPLSEDDSTKMSFSVVRWSPDGGRILVSSQKGWHLLDVDGDMELAFEFEEDEDTRPRRTVQSWSEDGRSLIVTYSARDHWDRGLQRIDLRSGRAEDLVRDANLYRAWNVSEDGERIVYQMSDGDRPHEIYVADGDLSHARKLTDTNPQLDGVTLTRSELVEYLDVDGNTLYGILYYPIDYDPSRTYPLVAEIYETFFDNGFNENMNLLTAQGWFGFRPSVHLEIGFPGEAWLKGVTAGINKLIDRGLVDEDRLGVHGTSYGGYATNLLITQTNRFAAAVNISGKVNIISFLGDSPKITTRNYTAAEIGQDRIGATLWEQPQKYIEHSAIMFADRIETPLLMLTGEGDWNVPATNQREMYYALRRLGKEVVWVNYMRAGHGAGRAGIAEDYLDHWRRMFEWYSEHFEEAAEGAGVAQGDR